MAWLDTVNKDGKRYLRVGFKLPGNSGKFREPLGLEDNRRNRALARARVQQAIEREIATGTFDYAKRFPDSPRVKRLGLQTEELITLGEFAEKVWWSIAAQAGSSTQLIMGMWTFFVRTLIGQNRHDAAPGDQGQRRPRIQAGLECEENEDRPSAQCATPISARRKMIALRELGAILKLARRLDHVAKDLMFYVDKSFADEAAIKDAPGEKLSPFTADEVARILESASEDDPSGWERRILQILFFMGMRRGEAFGLRWLNVFFDRGVIAVRRSLTIHGESSPKTGRSILDIEMLPRVREALLEQRRWVQGAPLDWLQRQMGHEDLQTLIRHYWRYINPQRLSSDVVARLESLSRDESLVQNAQLMPNSTDAAGKAAPQAASTAALSPLNH